MASIELHNIIKKYGDNEVVHNINLDIHDGEFMVLVGPSGCGKSTTLRMIAGLEEISGGALSIGGKIVNHMPPKDRNIAMVFQNYALYPHMSVYENIAFGLILAKIPKDEIEKRVNEVAHMLEIEHLLDRKPKNMSGGQRQRVALGRAIARRSEVFLFDEPLSNLDAQLRVSMRVRLAQLHSDLKNRGLSHTMVYVTHDQIEAMTLGHRICVMEGGHIRQVDTPLNLYNFPANKFVAEFIGSPSMNFMRGILEQAGEKYFVKTSGGSIPIASQKIPNFYLGKEIIIGVRAEHIRIESDPSYASLKSTVSVVERMGNEDFVYFPMEGALFVMRKPSETEEILKNKSYGFSFAPDKIHLFDPDTEENICWSEAEGTVKNFSDPSLVPPKNK